MLTKQDVVQIASQFVFSLAGFSLEYSACLKYFTVSPYRQTEGWTKRQQGNIHTSSVVEVGIRICLCHSSRLTKTNFSKISLHVLAPIAPPGPSNKEILYQGHYYDLAGN